MSHSLANGAQCAKRILIIEDDAVVARLYQNRLRKEGYLVEIASEGQEGFFSILKNKPDGVLLDLMLPNMDGVQILRKTRAQKQFETMPIIVFSNSFMTGLLDGAVAAGATRVFNKSDPATTQNIVAGFLEAFFPYHAAQTRAAYEAPVAPPELSPPEEIPFTPPTTPPPTPAPQSSPQPKAAFAPPKPRFGAIPTPKQSFDANGAACAARTPTSPKPQASASADALRMADGSRRPAPVVAPVPAPAPAPAPVASGQTIFIAKNSPLLPSLSRTPGACSPPIDTAFVPMTEEALALQQETIKVFFESGPETIAGIRKSVRGYSKDPASVNGQAQLNGLFRKIHSLTGAAGMASLESIGNFSACLEAYLRELLLNPASFQASTLRTLTNAVDLLGIMFDQGPDFHCPIPSECVVMVVDDDVISRRAVTFGLEKAGLKAMGTADPRHALEELEKSLYELIFLDVDMPEMDGFELCSRIRYMPDYLLTPIVFITGMTDFQTRAKSITSGGNDFISKPLCFMELAVKALTFLLKGRLTGHAEVEKVVL